MKDFLKYNKHKLPLIFFGTSIFPAITLVIVLIIYWVDEFNLLVFSIIIGCGFFLQFFILILSYFEWINRQNSRKITFQNKPFNKLHEVGFSDELFNKNNKWYFTELVPKGKIDGFSITIDPMLGYSNTIGIVAEVEKQYNYKALIKNLNKSSLIYGRDGITKLYDTRKPRTLKEFVTYTERFTKILKEEGFEPKIT